MVRFGLVDRAGSLLIAHVPVVRILLTVIIAAPVVGIALSISVVIDVPAAGKLPVDVGWILTAHWAQEL